MKSTRAIKTTAGFYMILALLLSAFFSPSAFAQTFVYRVDPVPVMTTNGTSPVGGFPIAYFVPNATIRLCTNSTCTALATAYTDATGNTACSTSTPVTLPGTSVCVATAGAQGQFGFWIQPGTYYFTVTTSTGTFGPYPISSPTMGTLGGPGIVSANVSGGLAAMAANIDCSRLTGASASIKITACATALGSTGGTADTSNIPGAQAWNTDAFSAITAPVDFICGATTFTVSTNSVIPANVHLVAKQGCVFSVNSGVTLSISGSLDGSSRTQHFAGSGTVTLATTPYVYPEWFGGSDAALQVSAAIAGLPSTGGTIDSSGLCGAQSFSVDPFGGTSKAVDLILCPGATYTASAAISPASSSRIRGGGYGSTIIKASGAFSTSANLISVSSKTLVSIEELTLNGNSRALECVNLTGSAYSIIRNTELVACTHAGVELDSGSTDNLIQGNYAHSISGGTGVGIFIFSGGLRNRIIGNLVVETAIYGILIDGGTNGGASSPSNENVVTGNTVSSTTGFGIGIEGSKRNVVSSNTINVAGTYGGTIDADNATGNPESADNVFSANVVTAVKGVRVSGSGNQVIGNHFIASDTGVSVTNQGGITTAIIDNLIKDNLINGTMSAGNKLGIQASEGSKITIDGNQINGADANGILIQISGAVVSRNVITSSGQDGILASAFTGSNVVIESNVVSNSSISSGGTYAGIQVNCTGQVCTNFRVADNVIYDTNASPTEATGVWIRGNASGNFVKTQATRNRFLGSHSGIIDQVVSTGLLVYGDSYLQTYTANGNLDVYLGDGPIIQVTLASNSTINDPQHKVIGDIITFKILQDGTGGRSLAWDAIFKKTWSDTGNTAGKMSTIQFFYDGTNMVQVGAQSAYN